VEPSREQLTQRLQDLSDGELLGHLRERTLTPLALEVATDILQARGLAPPPANEAAERLESHPVDAAADGTLVTVADQLTQFEATVQRGCLESHGIFVSVWGEHLERMDIIYSLVGGGTHQAAGAP
jgi:hypothetical protein